MLHTFQHTSHCRSRRLQPRAEERVAALPQSPEGQAAEDLWAAGGAATLPDQSRAAADAARAGWEDRTRLEGLTYSKSNSVLGLLWKILNSHLLRLLQVRESSLEKHLEASHVTAAPHKDLIRLQEERQVLQERVEVRVHLGTFLSGSLLLLLTKTLKNNFW